MIPVEKNKEYEVTVENIASDGNGVAHIDGFAVFIPMSAVGDVLQIKIIKVNRRYAVGRVEKIIKPSKTRCKPICRQYKRCGGCNIGHIKYDEQLRIKINIVKDALERIGGVDRNIVEKIIGMDNPKGYRNKMIFPADKVNNEICFGFYASRSHTLIPVENCYISAEISDGILNAVKQYMNETGMSVYNEAENRGAVRRVFIRKGFVSNEIMVVVCVAEYHIKNRERLIELLRDVSEDIKSIIININPNPNNLVLGNKNITLWGKDYIEDILCGYKYRISPHSFFQVNPVQTEKLYNTAIEMAGLTGKENLLDIYSGIGTISITASGKAKEVIGIEVVEQAVIDAEENVKANGVENCVFYAGKAESVVPEIMEKGFLPDVAIIDPPRKGSDEKTLMALINSSVSRIVYVSCNPSTLARDVSFLADNGFRAEKAVAVDLFPYTCHVETVVLMSRKNK